MQKRTEYYRLCCRLFGKQKVFVCMYAQILIQNLRMEVFELALAED